MKRTNYDMYYLGFIILSIAYFIYSYIGHYNIQAWLLFSLPAVLLWIGLILTHKYYAFSRLVYIVALLHIIVMLTGAKYTYSANPTFDTISSMFNLGRNHFDRVGHFFQGLTPAIMAYEILLNRSKLKKDWIFYFLIISVSMGISAVYELTEYLVTVISGYPPEYVLGNQGDVWDTQNDMLIALIGAIVGVFIKIHKTIIKHIVCKKTHLTQ